MNPRWIEEMGFRMGEVYGAVTDRILVNLARHFPYEGKDPGGSWQYQIRKLAEMGQVTRETEAIILQSMKGADQALANLLEDTIRESLKDVEGGFNVLPEDAAAAIRTVVEEANSL